MELTVLQRDSQSTAPWYGGGLRFTCTQCGNCCTGPPGYVWISDTEIRRLARHLKLSRTEVIQQYCNSVGSRHVLKERRNERGEHDCIFLRDEKVTSNGIVHTRRSCSIYPVRPLQCRTWPFWDGTLASPESWRNAAQRCHGMNYGSRIYSREEIDALRTAKDWPGLKASGKKRKRSRS